MSDTNYIGGIVKILETPKQNINSNVINVRFRAQLSQVRNTHIVVIVFWGNLARDVSNYYKINDYILIEGYLSLQNKTSSDSLLRSLKNVKITVRKIYPLKLSLLG